MKSLSGSRLGEYLQEECARKSVPCLFHPPFVQRLLSLPASLGPFRVLALSGQTSPA